MSCAKGDHMYQSHPKIHFVFDCEVEPEKVYSEYAIIGFQKITERKSGRRTCS